MSQEIKFEENDVIGEATLDVIAKADKFNRWMYQTIKPYCKGKTLEIGSGIGNISTFFLEDDFEMVLTDIRQNYFEKLNQNFNQYSNFLGSEIMNLTDEDFDKKFEKHLGKYDTVFALNVVEHIKDDVLAIKNCKKLLKDNGHLIILVPSYQTLYNKFDKELGHYRRYTKTSLSNIFKLNNFKIMHKQHFNFIGILGWYVTGSILKKESIPGGQMKLYNTLVPIFKIIDKLIANKIGLSTIVVGKK
ncbi:bifunctional 2-polyprenyl-6-hydroxyphenol methylase/3-demethylubiquinol 3-O-methyltransferase UbiG [Lacinutrix sp. 5H-3-7-4]|uniref:class I SAM-dependent methyltransferase n=1 Tax=Lacinutrix sp. (strain 5H-3-7-4) TaxID=983544 RepID=UPI00020A39D3|nr:class I SAM-dependent methyltransferase [Lacinutrix sp. 5H-3-7-4]AEH02077.1 Methyltransferase type 12 [Lacinutrix sp. 5H-3-7-4]